MQVVVQIVDAFQFQIGAIRGQGQEQGQRCIMRFQFQIGAIRGAAHAR